MANFEAIGRQIKKSIALAKDKGAVKVVDVDGDDIIIISATHAKTTPPSHFTENDKLLLPPKARAAYSDRTAWLMAELSALSYVKFENDTDAEAMLLKELHRAGFTETTFFDNSETGTQALLTVRPEEFAVLAFRGTEKDRRDILTDLNARFYDTPSGKSHQGFAQAFESVQTNIREALNDMIKKNKNMPIFITGHSLGGALATVATCNLENEFLISACYTFGSPRVGNAEWSDHLKTPLYRVVHGADGVTLVPASGMARTILIWSSKLPVISIFKGTIERFSNSGFVGFQHAGDMRFICKASPMPQLKIGAAAAFTHLKYLIIGKLVGAIYMLNPKALSATFADHSISHYRSILRQIAEYRN